MFTHLYMLLLNLTLGSNSDCPEANLKITYSMNEYYSLFSISFSNVIQSQPIDNIFNGYIIILFNEYDLFSKVIQSQPIDNIFNEYNSMNTKPTNSQKVTLGNSGNQNTSVNTPLFSCFEFHFLKK